jgi:hypothetical protein
MLKMLREANCLSPWRLFLENKRLPLRRPRHPTESPESGMNGQDMARFLNIVCSVLLVSLVGAGNAYSQAAAAATPSVEASSAEPSDTGEIPDNAVDPASLLPDLPPISSAKASLIGGIIQKLDRVRDQFTVQIFGGGRMKISFDTRTQIYTAGGKASAADLHPGQRVYVDTILDGSTVFARNIRLKTGVPAGESQGVVLGYRSDRSELAVRDMLSPHALKVRVTSDTHIVNGGKPGSTSDLSIGALVAVTFGSDKEGRDVAQNISILALPGTSFTFAGHVLSLDLHAGMLALLSSTDGKTYEISLDPGVLPVDSSLTRDADITVLALFDGNRYVARSLTVNAGDQK